MNDTELKAHINEYEKEYRWLAKYFMKSYDDFLEDVAIMKTLYGETVKMLRQYANDVLNPSGENFDEYYKQE